MTRRAGFTLVEVLISLVLTGLLMTTLFATFRTSATSWQLANKFVEQTEEERQLINLLQRHMRQVIPARMDGDLSANAFQGWETGIRYVAPLSISAASRPYLIDIQSELPGMRGTWIRFAPYRVDLKPEELLAGVEYFQLSENLKLSFYYYGETAEQVVWNANWESRPGLPTLLAVDFSGEGSRSPQLVFPVIANDADSDDPELRKALEILNGFKEAS